MTVFVNFSDEDEEIALANPIPLESSSKYLSNSVNMELQFLPEPLIHQKRTKY